MARLFTATLVVTVATAKLLANNHKETKHEKNYCIHSFDGIRKRVRRLPTVFTLRLQAGHERQDDLRLRHPLIIAGRMVRIAFP